MLEELSSKVRTENNLNPDTKDRLDCTSYYSSDESLRGLEFFKNKKGQIYFYRTKPKIIVEAAIKRQTDLLLGGKSINLSSIYIDGVECSKYGYGNPPAKPMLGKKNKKPNPLFSFRNDLYLFVMNEERTQIELVIIPDQKSLWLSHYQKLIADELEEELNFLRSQSKPLFNYFGDD